MVISKEINDITIILKDYWMYWWLNILKKVIQLILNFTLNLKYYSDYAFCPGSPLISKEGTSGLKSELRCVLFK